MTQEKPPELRGQEWLKTLGISSLIQLDVLAFICRHRTSLVGGDLIARLLGYTTENVVNALDVLESLELVARTRATHGVRIYEAAIPTDPPRREAFSEVMKMMSSRAGRLTLSRKLARPEKLHGSKRSTLTAAQPSAKASRGRQRSRARSVKAGGIGKGGEPWLKAV